MDARYRIQGRKEGRIGVKTKKQNNTPIQTPGELMNRKELDPARTSHAHTFPQQLAPFNKRWHSNDLPQPSGAEERMHMYGMKCILTKHNKKRIEKTTQKTQIF